MPVERRQNSDRLRSPAQQWGVRVVRSSLPALKWPERLLREGFGCLRGEAKGLSLPKILLDFILNHKGSLKWWSVFCSSLRKLDSPAPPWGTHPIISFDAWTLISIKWNPRSKGRWNFRYFHKFIFCISWLAVHIYQSLQTVTKNFLVIFFLPSVRNNWWSSGEDEYSPSHPNSDRLLQNFSVLLLRSRESRGNIGSREYFHKFHQKLYWPPLRCPSGQTCYSIHYIYNDLQKGTVLDSGGSQASFLMQASVLTKRSFVNMSRDFGYYWLRLVIYIVVTICIGTIYLNVGTGYNSIFVRFYSRLWVIFGPLFELDYMFNSYMIVLQFHFAGKGCVCIVRLRVRHIHVDRRVPLLRRRHEGKSLDSISITIWP